jgi:hypothetical protein
MFSYADRRAEGTMTPKQQCELVRCLQDEKEALLEKGVKLTSKSERIKKALQRPACAEPVAKKMADPLKALAAEERSSSSKPPVDVSGLMVTPILRSSCRCQG